jgi:hypothetical protein
MKSRKLMPLAAASACLAGAPPAAAHHADRDCRPGADVQIYAGDSRPVDVRITRYAMFQGCLRHLQVTVGVWPGGRPASGPVDVDPQDKRRRDSSADQTRQTKKANKAKGTRKSRKTKKSTRKHGSKRRR